MTLKSAIATAAVFAFSVAFANDRFDRQVYQNGIGDSTILTIGGYTRVKEVLIDMSPVDAPDDDARYSVRFRIWYRNNRMARPITNEDADSVLEIGRKLNEWLEKFVDSEYRGAEYEKLLNVFYKGELAKDLNDRFPSYVADEVANMDSGDAFDIDTVEVELEAAGKFRRDLEKMHRGLPVLPGVQP